MGILPIEEAQKLAIEKGLDLAEVAPNGKPPVCRIMDYGKFRYEQQKKEKEAKKKQQVIKVKEIRLSPKIEDHDLGYKAKHAIEFLKNGDRVKVSVRFRGREMGHKNMGREVLEKFAKETEEYSIIDKRPKMEGRQMIMFLSAKSDN